MLGQLVRVVPGWHKLTQSQREGEDVHFSGAVVFITLLIGGTAGALAAMTFADEIVRASFGAAPILSLMAAGYAGADFIEAFAGRYLGRAGGGGTSMQGVGVSGAGTTPETGRAVG